MKLKRLLTGALAAVIGVGMVFGFAGCSTDDDGNGLDNEKVDTKRTQLYVYNYNGGFGSDWLGEAKRKYEELHAEDVYETGKQGVQIIVENEKTGMDNNPETTLAKTSELFFTEGAAYRALVASYPDKFEDITEAVKGENPYEDGKTIEDKLTPEQKT